MNAVRFRLILGIFLLSAACTKGVPDFEVLDENNVPRPKFAGSYTKSLQTYSDALTFQIDGECDPKIRRISGLAMGTSAAFSTFESLAVSGVSVTCATDQKFSFELKSLASLGYTVAEGRVYEIQLRGETAGGTSLPSYIRILYTSAAGGMRPILLSSGGTGSTLASHASGISASVRISHKSNRAPGSVQASGEDAFLKTDGTGPTGIRGHIGVRINH